MFVTTTREEAFRNAWKESSDCTHGPLLYANALALPLARAAARPSRVLGLTQLLRRQRRIEIGEMPIWLAKFWAHRISITVTMSFGKLVYYK